jgi:hypothetical protein
VDVDTRLPEGPSRRGKLFRNEVAIETKDGRTQDGISERRLGAAVTNQKKGIFGWASDVRESGIWFVLALLLTLGFVVGALDVVTWDKEFGKSVLAEGNAVLIDIFLIGFVIAAYDYRRRRRGEPTPGSLGT